MTAVVTVLIAQFEEYFDDALLCTVNLCCYGPEIELKFAFGWVAWRMKTCNRPGVIATFHLKFFIDLFWALTFASGHIMQKNLSERIIHCSRSFVRCYFLGSKAMIWLMPMKFFEI